MTSHFRFLSVLAGKQTVFTLTVILLVYFTWFCLPQQVIAQEQPADDSQSAEAVRPVDFSRHIRPILARRCYACHGPDEAEAGLNLTHRESAIAELDSGEFAIVANQPEKSELLLRILTTDHDLQMPPEGDRLTDEEAAKIKLWIEQGATWSQHWAWSPAQRHPVPQVKQQQLVQNPIDAFLLDGLEARGLSPNPKAEARDLARRIHYNVTGLAPSHEFIAKVEGVQTQQQWEEIVDGLLQQPEFGEHFARRWLDVVRYAETNSFERDGLKPNAWRYRDYVIRAFNNDKPYTQFLKEQLAGDEMPGRTTESIIAAGYYRLGVWDDEPADALQAHFDELDDLLTTTTQGMLGLTVNCARCHEHKIDPIPQEDYYQMLAFFEGLSPYGSRGEQNSYNQWDISDDLVSEAHQQQEQILAEIDSELRELRELVVPRMPAKMTESIKRPERLHEVVHRNIKKYATEAEYKVYQGLEARRKEITEDQIPSQSFALSVVKYNPTPEPTHLLNRGNPRLQGKQVEPGFPELFGVPDPVLPEVKPGDRTDGRRTVLANWIASDDNDMTARVIVNRIWQHHFGRGIVRSANNFGELGDPPTHPELLDWLALKLIEENWSLKAIHRLIMTSNAYRMSAAYSSAAGEVDPNNDLFWRFNMRRLSAEEARDTILQVSGQLNSEMYGPPIYPTIPKEVLAGQSKPGSGWGTSSPEQQARRSIYIHVKRSLITPMLSVFDFPDPDVTCEGRFVTTQPGQALQLLNSDELQEHAQKLAAEISATAGDDSTQRIITAFEMVLRRKPTDQEITQNLKFLDEARTVYQLDSEQSWKLFSLAMLNLNEFLYLD